MLQMLVLFIIKNKCTCIYLFNFKKLLTDKKSMRRFLFAHDQSPVQSPFSLDVIKLISDSGERELITRNHEHATETYLHPGIVLQMNNDRCEVS